MSTGRQALENQNFQVDKYYSSEIKPYAIKLTQFHYPDTIQVGNILEWKTWDIVWHEIDLILSGSPCQDLSAAGKKAGINGAKSSLFFVFIEILEYINQERKKQGKEDVLFFQENVGSANKYDVGVISRALGVYPCRMNSSLVTAQLRDRYYWSNIKTKELLFDIVTDFPEPKDLKIQFKDIITSGFVERLKSTALLEGYVAKNTYKDVNSEASQKHLKKRDKMGMRPVVYVDKDKHSCLNTKSGEQSNNQYSLKHRNETTGMITLIYEVENELFCKTNTIKSFEKIEENDVIDLSFPKSTTRRGRVNKKKAPCLMESNNDLYTLQNAKLRTVNKVEMCRLQGFHDDYCDILSTRQAGSLLGDGWTLPMIEHFFSFLPSKFKKSIIK
jgi:site-specific DNA-cytosine methylase